MITKRPFSLMAGFVLLLSAYCLLPSAFGQTSTATLSGTVEDQNGAVLPGATVILINAGTGFQRTTTTNDGGSFTVPLLPPATYKVRVERDGFAPVEVRDVVLNVGDQKSLQIQLKAGDVRAEVQVINEAPLIDESPAVGTVVDRQFVENIPLNARSLQSLISLVPGVTRTAGPILGQFSVNGQRHNANYFTIDGVSANIGTHSFGVGPQAFTGTLPGQTSIGTTNNLISIDALQEFKIQTSSFAPEFGRTPGAQITMLSRSGTKEFHGAVFEYVRNDTLDANDWFANRAGLDKPALRHNQFGGVLGGPIFKEKTFFFFSYEGLRLRQPQVANSPVPALRVRQIAPAAIQTLLNAYPIPTGPEIPNPNGTLSGRARFTSVYSDASSIDATSIRVDHVLRSGLNIFGRFNYSPSTSETRNSLNPAALRPVEDLTTTLTVGATFAISSRTYNDLRINYSHVRASNSAFSDSFGGAVPLSLAELLPQRPENATGAFNLIMLGLPLQVADQIGSLQRQFNLVDTFSYIVGGHQLKLGFDYRLLNPRSDVYQYSVGPFFQNEAQAVSSVPIQISLATRQGFEPRLSNFSIFAQDTWSVNPRLTLTYGLRWEVNPAPSEVNGVQPFVVQGFDQPATATVIQLPQNEDFWKTTYDNFAPRVGVSYQLGQRTGWDTVLRGGFGLFYDVGSGPGTAAFSSVPPFTASRIFRNTSYPLTPQQAAPLSLSPPGDPGFLSVFDPDLKLPLTYQWNLAVEQTIASKQVFTATYVAALGRRLLRNRIILSPVPSVPTLGSLTVFENGATSYYHALQLQLQRRLHKGLQFLTSYSLSRAVDEISDEFNPEVWLPAKATADFDVRHAFKAAITYDLPGLSKNRLLRALSKNWSIDSIVRAQSGNPFTPLADFVFAPDGRIFQGRADRVPGVPVYLEDRDAPGGRRVNPEAFTIPPFGEAGNAERNSLRGFGSWQIDFALRRKFSLGENINLQIRGEAFNIFNHPNFGLPVGSLFDPQFGQATTMLNRSFQGFGFGTSPLYEIGGPRSIQLALRLEF
ncbi:MAG TPA: TonB-dependent receptor [Pyrinomonadaceae bacterium]|nr:TonB-dependent receptor [Pyrinomonadaceae bacterium]